MPNLFSLTPGFIPEQPGKRCENRFDGFPVAGSILKWSIAIVFLLLLFAPYAGADQFDTLRLVWQTNLISSGGSPSSIASNPLRKMHYD